MPQLFNSNANTIARVSIVVGVFGVILAAWAWAVLNRSGYNTGAFLEIQQPVQFSHKHHVGDDGIDCRYCHTSVETSASAGMPPTQTCMNCHSQIWADSPYLAPVRDSFANNKPIEWRRVHDLPDYVYFNHSIHVAKGVGCSTCHGRIDEMPVVYQKAPLQMQWCLECHRQPELFIRDKSEIFNMEWRAEYDAQRVSTDDIEAGKKLRADYKIKSLEVMTSCSTCHR